MQVLGPFVQLRAPVDDVTKHPLLHLVEGWRGGEAEEWEGSLFRHLLCRLRDPAQNRGPGNRLLSHRDQQPRDRQPWVEGGQDRWIDQQQLPAPQGFEGGGAGPEGGAPADLASEAGAAGDEGRASR